MEKKYIEEMNKEELTKVFHANSKLQNDVLDDMLDTEMYYIGEQMDYIRNTLSDYSISTCSHNFMSIRDYDHFVENVEEMEKSIPVLIDKDLPILEKALQAREQYREVEYGTDEYEEAEEVLEKVAEELSDLILDRFSERLEGCYKKEYQLDYFLDFYASERLDQDCYIEGECFTLYSDISYTKSFN